LGPARRLVFRRAAPEGPLERARWTGVQIMCARGPPLLLVCSSEVHLFISAQVGQPKRGRCSAASSLKWSTVSSQPASQHLWPLWTLQDGGRAIGCKCSSSLVPINWRPAGSARGAKLLIGCRRLPVGRAPPPSSTVCPLWPARAAQMMGPMIWRPNRGRHCGASALNYGATTAPLRCL